jgi:hypothetical protein
MGILEVPFVAFIFALLLIGYSIWDLDQLSGPGVSGHYSLALPRVAPAGAVLAGVTARARAVPGAAAISGPGAAASAASAAVATEPATPSQATSGTPAGGAGRAAVLAPWVATGSRIAMGVTMTFMLLISI